MTFSAILSTCLVVLLIRPYYVECQCIEKRPDNVKDKAFPDLLKLDGYTTSVEINYYASKKSNFVYEYYDVQNLKGRVDLLENNEWTKFFYFYKHNEAFTVKNVQCEINDLDNFVFPFPKFLENIWTYRENDRLIIGPSALFRRAYLDYIKGPDKTNIVYMGNYREPIRGIKAEYWIECIQNNQITIKYYFEVEDWKGPHGDITSNIPVRIQVQGLNQYANYEFVNFNSEISNEDEVLSIPIGIGCDRLVKNVRTPPSFDSTDISYIAEVIYKAEEEKYSYIATLNYAFDLNFNLIAFHPVSWGDPAKDGKRSAKTYITLIYDKNNKFLYTIDEETKKCKITINETLDENIYAPGNSLSVLIGKELLSEDAENFKYMGTVENRGLVSDAYEFKQIVLAGKTGVEEIVITKFYVAIEGDYNSGRKEENVPLQIKTNFINTEKKIKTDLVINIADFSTTIQHKLKVFDISSCFNGPSQSQWLQFAFTVINNEGLLRNMEHLLPLIKSEVVEMLYLFSGLTPLRIPKILVDFNTNGIDINILVLERPDYLLDFDFIGNGMIKTPVDTIGMISLEECAQLCLNYFGACSGFSHCGKTCYIKRDTEKNIVQTSNCAYYHRTEKFDIQYSIPTLYDVRRRLEEAFSEGELKMLIEVKDESGNSKIYEFKMTELDSSSENMDLKLNRKIDDFDDHYVEFKYGYKLQKQANHVKSYGTLPYETCQSICLENPECESMSSCLIIPECLISSKHGEDISNTDFVSDSKCIILTRNYIDAFKTYPGILAISSAKQKVKAKDQDECARICLNSKKFACHSFDFCPRAQNEKCLLHSTHFSDKKDDLKVDASGLCGHYSRNFIFDFNKMKKKSIVGDLALIGSDVTVDGCAKMCIENGGFVCRSFDFCQGTNPFKSSCRLTQKTKAEIELIDSAICTTYVRQNAPQDITKPSTKKYTKGTAIGLGIFFFIVGIGIGIVALFAYSWFTGKKF